jgi:hypothetical protein
MARAYSVRELELKPGVTDEEFERFLRDEWARVQPFRGLRALVLKGERGQRTGKYLLVYEWESVERWLETYPSVRETSEEMRQFGAANAQVVERFQALAEVPGGAGVAYTAYREIATLGE